MISRPVHSIGLREPCSGNVETVTFRESEVVQNTPRAAVAEITSAVWWCSVTSAV